LVLIAIADNIADSFGIHVYQESQSKSPKQVRRTTFNNFATRLIVVAVYAMIILFTSISLAVILSIIFSALIIIVLSYFIAKHQKVKPFVAIAQHTALAAIIIIASFILRGIIQGLH
jgi:vacuolar iron transporter family protein